MQLFLKTTCFVKDKKLNRNGRFKNDRFRSVGYTSRNLKQNNLLKKRVVKTIVFESQKNHLKNNITNANISKKTFTNLASVFVPNQFCFKNLN